MVLGNVDATPAGLYRNVGVVSDSHIVGIRDHVKISPQDDAEARFRYRLIYSDTVVFHQMGG